VSNEFTLRCEVLIKLNFERLNMFKKSILMLAVFLVVGLASVQAQNQARMEQLMREAEQIEARVDARGGTPTVQEMQRLMEIQQELMLGGYFNNMDVPMPQVQQQPQPRQQQQPQQQRDTFPAGQTQGWPSASQFSQVSLPALRQPARLTATYTFDRESQTIEIYIRGGTQATINDLARQIQAGTNWTLPH
jgi:hypothetical protein